MGSATPRSLRRAYVEWVEEQIEEFKEQIPRAQLLAMADEVVTALRVDGGGQYQLTEMLLCHAIDRRIFRMLRLPGYRAWCAQHTSTPSVISFPLPERFVSSPPVARPAPALAADEEEQPREPLACVG